MSRPSCGISARSVRCTFPAVSVWSPAWTCRGPLTDAPAFSSRRASLLDIDRRAGPGNSSGQLRIRGEVRGIEILDPVSGGGLVVAGEAAAGDARPRDGRRHILSGGRYHGPVHGRDRRRFPRRRRGLSWARSEPGSRDEHPGVITTTRRRFRSAGHFAGPSGVRWIADLARTDPRGRRTGDTGASSRWPVTRRRPGRRPGAESDLLRLLTAAGGPSETVPVGLEGLGGVPFRNRSWGTDPAFRLNRCCGGMVSAAGQIDELAGAWRACEQWEQTARELVATALRDRGLGDVKLPGQFWLAIRQSLEINCRREPCGPSSPPSSRRGAGTAHGTRADGRAARPGHGRSAPQVVVSGSLRARIVPGSARHVGTCLASPCCTAQRNGGSAWRPGRRRVLWQGGDP